LGYVIEKVSPARQAKTQACTQELIAENISASRF
jgi:hypothetical protein